MDDLPTLPNVIIKVMKIIDNPNSNATHLTELISMDQSLTVKALKLANSAYYGFPREIVTVTEAVVVLGFLTVRNLILTSALYNIFVNDSGADSEFDKKKFWKHSIATAFCARLIVAATGTGHSQAEEEEAFTAGLLHDIGKVFLDLYAHNDFAGVIRESRKGKVNEMFFQTEKRLLGVDHAELGALMIEKWNLPENFIEPIRHHHNPKDAKEGRHLTNILHIADIISKLSIANYDGSSMLKAIDEDALKSLKLNEENIITLLKNLEFEMSNADLFINS
jgi:putative nucleotidyltransferase with HDIG domain